MKAKKPLALLLAMLIACAFPMSVNATENDTLLTVDVESTFILSIPKSQTIDFGKVDTDIGSVKVTGNVKPGESVEVTSAKTDFVNTDSTTNFPFELYTNGITFTSETWNETELKSEPAKETPLTVHIPIETWNKAEAGNYKATITFTAQLQNS